MKKIQFDTELLKRLCLTDGVSGYEENVAKVITDEVKQHCDELYTDRLGNLIAFKKGRKVPSKKIMFCAHMDEVGFAVTGINDDGTLSFDEVGMMNTVLPSKRVRVGKNGINGVISSRPIHLAENRDKPVKRSDLCIDIGTKSREESEKLGVYGDYAAFSSDFCTFGNGLVKSKALDDRIGCAVMCLLLKSDLEYDTYFVFTVGEELGGVGAKAATHQIKPDVCFVLEGTTASDLSGASEEDKVCSLRCGAVVPFMDGGTIYDRGLYTGIRKLADEKCIPNQTKTKVAGGTDASKIRKSGSGVRVAAISLPCRYIHTSASVASLCDMQSVLDLSVYLYTNLDLVIGEEEQ